MKHFEAKEKHAHKLAQAHQHDMMQSYDAGKRAAEWFHRPAYDVKNIKNRLLVQFQRVERNRLQT